MVHLDEILAVGEVGGIVDFARVRSTMHGDSSGDQGLDFLPECEPSGLRLEASIVQLFRLPSGGPATARR